jgi:RNA polymerase sigma factor (sigma-70 family)
METHWIFSGCDLEDETRIARYWEERSLEFEGKLNALSAEPIELRLAVHHDDGPPAWEVQAALHLPAATLVAEEEGDRLEEVLDGVVCELARHIDEYNELPAASADLPAGAVLDAALDAVAPLLCRTHAQGRSEAFFALLEPILRRLAGYLQCHLETLARDDGMPCEEVTADDVLDESLTRAWDNFGTYAAKASSPEHSLDRWLMKIVEDVLKQSNHSLAEQSLEEEVVEAPDDADDPLRDAWTEAGGYQQTVELSELIAGNAGVDVWDRLSAKEGNSRLAEALGKLPRDQRQALVLSLIEGFTATQIADFQGRSAGDVEEDIRLAEQSLRQDLDGTALDKLQAELTARHRPRRRTLRHRS